MSDKLIETPKTEDTVIIAEKPKDLKYLWSQFKESPNRWVWLGLIISVVSFLMSLPYFFFGTYLVLYLVSMLLVALVTLCLGFNSISKYSKLSKLNRFVFFFACILSLYSLYHTLNYDRHVLVDYHERLVDFPYGVITKDIANPQIGATESFTILIKSEDLKWKGPDFDSLATKVHGGSKEYLKDSLEEFKPFTLYYGSDAQGKAGDIKGKRTVYGWFGSTSTDFVIKLER